MSADPRARVLGVILAGGLARRMGGGDKCLRPLAGRPLLGRIIDRVRPQVGHLILNANGDPARFAPFGLEVVADGVEGFAGPLAGVLAAMEWARANRPDCDWVASVPGDAPFLPEDLVTRLLASAADFGADLACAESLGNVHPVVGLWPVSLAPDLRHALVEEGVRKLRLWTGRHKLIRVDFAPGPDGVDPFFNANAPEDFTAAEGVIATNGG